MAKGKYSEWLTDEKLLLLECWARDGLTDEQIAHNMGVSYTSLKDWKSNYPSISAALKKGKEVVDFEVENALLKRALGYTCVETTRERIVDTGQKERHGGESKLTESEWEFAVKRFGGKCAYCGNACAPTKDHIIPLNSGGKLDRHNVIPACQRCNSSKKDTEMLTWYKCQAFYSDERLSRIYEYLELVEQLDDMFDIINGELVVTRQVEKPVLPDVTAQIIWLKNRKPNEWRDKREMEVSGDMGVRIVDDLNDTT